MTPVSLPHSSNDARILRRSIGPGSRGTWQSEHTARTPERLRSWIVSLNSAYTLSRISWHPVQNASVFVQASPAAPPASSTPPIASAISVTPAVSVTREHVAQRSLSARHHLRIKARPQRVRMYWMAFLSSASFPAFSAACVSSAPPILIFGFVVRCATSFCSASALPLYLAATSLNDGPAFFAETEWHPVQPLFLISASAAAVSCACARPGSAQRADASPNAIGNFM